MKKVYIMQDNVSGVTGDVFCSASDDTVRRDFLHLFSNPDVPDYAVRDSVIICLGELHDEDRHDIYIAGYCEPEVVFRGDCYEVRKAREAALAESD